MRNARHYRSLLDRNPNAGVGFSLAAAAVYAARFGVCERLLARIEELEDKDTAVRFAMDEARINENELEV